MKKNEYLLPQITGKTSWLNRVVGSCMDIILPPCCSGCGVRLPVSGTARFCNRCGSAIHYLVPPVCRICGVEISAPSGTGYDPVCSECLNTPPPYTMARSVVRYESQVKRLVHKLKYRGELSVIPGLIELIGGFDLAEFTPIDSVVVVPLHIRRLRHRGFNQAAVLARLFFADRLNLVQKDWLFRTRNTLPQIQLDRNARRRNVRGAFQVKPTADLVGRRVCLVDDVFTTGTTVKECSKVLMHGGAAEVKVLTLARVSMSRSGRYGRIQ